MRYWRSVIVFAIISQSASREVTTQEGQELAAKFNLSYFEASAKENIKVDEIFFDIAEKIYMKIENNLIDLTNEVGYIYHKFRTTGLK